MQYTTGASVTQRLCTSIGFEPTSFCPPASMPPSLPAHVHPCMTSSLLAYLSHLRNSFFSFISSFMPSPALPIFHALLPYPSSWYTWSAWSTSLLDDDAPFSLLSVCLTFCLTTHLPACLPVCLQPAFHPTSLSIIHTSLPRTLSTTDYYTPRVSLTPIVPPNPEQLME